jgi:hypothetical protein
MPSPVGHALGGLIVALVFAPPPPHDVHEGHEGHEGLPGPKNSRLHVHRVDRVLRELRVHRAWWPVVGWCVVAACLPDVDFAWGRHNMETHSIGFALLLGVATLVWRPSAMVALACALAVSTHVLFDWLGSDDRAPFGVMALWPFTSEFFYADVWLFGAISRHYWRSDFLSQNVLAVLRELVILGPFVAILWFYRRGRFPRGKHG